MSRTRIVGGSITKITKGKHSIYSTENIEYIGKKVNFKGKEGNEFGEATPIEEVFESISKSSFIASVQFYRSKKQAESKYGINDTAYKGDFGFDKFDTKIHGEGLVKHYNKFREVQLNEKDLEDKPYLAYSPYLSIWPPGNPAGLPTEVTLYLQARKASIVRDTKELKFKLISSDPNIKVSPESVKLDIFEIGRKKDLLLVPIKITCTGVFKDDAYIYVYTDDDHAEKVGQLIVYANEKRYKTVIQPVLVKIKGGNVRRKIIKKEKFKEYNIDVDSIVEDFNKRSFNQAYMYAELSPDLYSMGISRSLIASTLTTIGGEDILRYEEKKEDYNNILEKRYAAAQVKEDTTAKDQISSRLKPIMRAVFKNFDKLYNFNTSKDKLKYIEKKRTNGLVTKAWEATIKTEEYKDYLREKKKYDEVVKELGSNVLNKKHTIHLFITPEIFCGGFKDNIISYEGTDVREDFGAILAYADTTNGGVVHVFEAATTKAEGGPSKEYIINSTILHEIGHSLSLHHTFGLEDVPNRTPGVTYKQDLDTEIKQLKLDIDELRIKIENELDKAEDEKKASKAEGFSEVKTKQLTKIREKYRNIRGLINRNKDTAVIHKTLGSPVDFLKNRCEEAKDFEISLTSIGECKELSDLQSYKSSLAKVEANLILKKQQRKIKKDNKKLKDLTYLEQKKTKSYTQENYLDYNDGSSIMERKIFYKWQWDQIRQFGVNNNFFKPL